MSFGGDAPDEGSGTSFDLTPEQRDNVQLLNELLGGTFAARYRDFCRLSAGMFDLGVSRPLAAHALRELDSSLRATLAGPMGAEAPTDPFLTSKLATARERLQLNFDLIHQATSRNFGCLSLRRLSNTSMREHFMSL
jgi:hypothetical protein